MSSFVDFSSWPREQEQAFVVFEQRGQESQTRAWIMAGVFSMAFFAFALFIYLGVAPVHADLTKGMNMENLSKKKKDKEAPAPAPDSKPAAEPKAETKAPEADKAAAPAEKPAEEKK